MVEAIHPYDEIDELILKEYDNNDEVINRWRLTAEAAGLMSGDLVAGLLTALDMIIDDTHNNRVDVTIDAAEVQDAININYDQGDTASFFLPDYRIMVLFPFPNEARVVTIQISDGLYGWLIKPQSVLNNILLLYQFHSPEFIQGFISMCNAAHVDFRRYVVGPPFKVQNRRPIYYEIRGYPIPPIPTNIEALMNFDKLNITLAVA